MEKEIYISGEYISGISKRPDLANKPCVLVYKENEFVVAVANGETAEPFSIPYNIVESCTFNTRVVTSEVMIGKGDGGFNGDMLALAVGGPTGLILSRAAGLNKIYNVGNIGKVDYSNMYQLVVEYRAPERNRRLVINVFENPKSFVEHFNTLKK